MTSTVTVTAHCSTEKRVMIIKASDLMKTPEITVINDGETHEDCFYDNMTITVKEVDNYTDK